jgi:hypothetical protein
MGAMSFLLPAGLAPDLARALERAWVAGGPDNMPWPTQVTVEPDRLIVRRDVDESGSLVTPWDIERAGRIMGGTATLIENETPYRLQLELARGKVNQVRGQVADWQVGGLQPADDLLQRVQEMSIGFSKAVTDPGKKVEKKSQIVLAVAYKAADEAVETYVEQMFAARHQRQPRLETTLGCCLGGVDVKDADAQGLLEICNGVALGFHWGEVEPAESEYNWAPYDALLHWALDHGLAIEGGPLIDFSAARLPDWLWLWERDLSSIGSFMCDYVETTIKRYAGQIRSWNLCAASNFASILGMGEDELMWLTARLVEAARQVDANLELGVGIVQPWGEYMAVEDRTHSPFIFADTLIRSGLNLAHLDLEIVMGITPRGSYCRDLLETSRLLDLYSLLGVPLHVTIGYPSAAGADAAADQDMKVDAGQWRGPHTPAVQADWGASFAALTLCKPVVRALRWAHAFDVKPHRFPHCGLFAADGKPKPVLKRLRELRENHLR